MKQLTFKTLGGETVSYPVRGKHYVQQRGYAAPPGTGPVGETCKTCRFIARFKGSSQRWKKCELSRHRWTCGKATDILASAHACKYWEQGPRPELGVPPGDVLSNAEVLAKLEAKR